MVQRTFYTMPLTKDLHRTAVPNRGFLDPWGSEARFSGVRIAIFEGERLYVLGSSGTFSKRTEIYVSLQVLLLKRALFSPIIPANVTNLTIAKCALWRLIAYGANMARLLFDATELESFWCSTRQSYQNCVQEPCLFQCPTYLCESALIWKASIKTIWAPRQRWVDSHILRPRSSPELSKLIANPTIFQKVFKFKVQVQMKSRKLTKHTFLTTKICNSFSSVSIQIWSWS